MEEYKFLLDIAIILAMTKSFSLVSKKFNMPPVVGALIAGIILGPVVFNVVSPSDSVLNLAEVGVVVLMFQAGLETDIDELKKRQMKIRSTKSRGQHVCLLNASW